MAQVNTKEQTIVAATLMKKVAAVEVETEIEEALVVVLIDIAAITIVVERKTATVDVSQEVPLQLLLRLLPLLSLPMGTMLVLFLVLVPLK
jgi:hypothetical protein